MFTNAFPSAKAFNAIPHFDEQDRSLSPALLKELSQIFVKHGVHNALAAGILHRHQTLTDDQIILHSIVTDYLDVAEIKDLNSVDTNAIHGCAFFLNEEGAFQPYEYTVKGGAIVLPHAFLGDLKSFMAANNLLTRLAIIINPHNGGLGYTYEHTIADGTVNIRVPQIAKIIQAIPVSTAATKAVSATPAVEEEACEWTFEGNGKISTLEGSEVTESTICLGGNCDKVTEQAINASTICLGGNCEKIEQAVNASTICLGGNCDKVAESAVNASTICLGGNCEKVVESPVVNASTICLGGNCDKVAESTIVNASTICLGGNCDKVTESAVVNASTICLGGNCEKVVESPVVNASTICLGGNCDKVTESAVVNASTICLGGNCDKVAESAVVNASTICLGGNCDKVDEHAVVSASTICLGGNCEQAVTDSTICLGGNCDKTEATVTAAQEACEWSFSTTMEKANQIINSSTICLGPDDACTVAKDTVVKAEVANACICMGEGAACKQHAPVAVC